MILLMFVGLYTSRVVLSTLGEDDYGLYNVVGGVVAMFSFLNGSLSTSTQRFMNYEIGRGEEKKVHQVFQNALLMHIILAIIIAFLSETIGLWFVVNKLNIEPGREFAAFWVYQSAILCVIVNIVQLPFMSVIIAHERMNAYAYISLLEGFLKLGMVFLLMQINADKLILYGFLYFLVVLIVAIVYNVYCRINFDEARWRINFDKDLFRSMLGFSGWNVFGGASYICNSQGLNIVLNLFFGTAINAARGLAFQVNSIVSQLVSNFQLAVKPQVVKYYAAGQIEDMSNLVFNAAKYSAFLMMIVNIPLIIEIKPILSLWLGEYPSYAPVFLSLVLARSIITSMTGNILMVAHASGYVRNVSIFSGLSLFMVLPISYVLLYFGCSPVVPFIVNIFSAFADAFFELFWMQKYVHFPMLRFYKEVYGRVFLLGILLFFLPASLHFLMGGVNQYVRMVSVGLLSVIFSLTMIYRYGIDYETKTKLEILIANRIHYKRKWK